MSSSDDTTMTPSENITSGPAYPQKGVVERISGDGIYFIITNMLLSFPSVLAWMIVDYIPFDVYFSSQGDPRLSSDKRTVTMTHDTTKFRNFGRWGTVIFTQYPLSMTVSRWSFHIVDFTIRDNNSFTLGILKLKPNSKNEYNDYHEIRARKNGDLFSYPDRKCTYSKEVKEFIEINSIITFDANLMTNTVSIEIFGVRYVDVIKVQNLGEWYPYIDCWTENQPIIVTVA